jgi:hypothetical protein
MNPADADAIVRAMVTDLIRTHRSRLAAAKALTQAGIPVSENSLKRWKRGQYSRVVRVLIPWLVERYQIDLSDVLPIQQKR